jgi:hypothetical protein
VEDLRKAKHFLDILIQHEVNNIPMKEQHDVRHQA